MAEPNDTLQTLAAQVQELRATIAQQQDTIARQDAQVSALQARLAAVEAAEPAEHALAVAGTHPAKTSRRKLLQLGGVAAATVAAGVLVAEGGTAHAASARADAVTFQQTASGSGNIAIEGDGTNGAQGVVGTSDTADGVAGHSTSGNGVFGHSTSSAGVFGSSTSNNGVVGQSTDGFGVTGHSTNLFGVRGESTNSIGVHGQSANNDGVRGDSTSGDGVGGVSATGTGVNGLSTDGTGVLGSSTNFFGVEGRSTNGVGVWGNSANNLGVLGSSTNSDGVTGSSTNSVGGRFDGGRAPLALGLAGTAGAPTSGGHGAGDIYLDSQAVMWVCVAEGTPGTWVRLTSVANGTVGGTVHYLPAPKRLLDARSGATSGLINRGPLGNLEIYALQVAGLSGSGIPAAALGLICNVTVLGPSQNGNLSLFPAGAAIPTTASMTFVAGAFLANHVSAALGSGGANQGKVNIQNQSGGNTPLVVDAVGFIM